MRKDNLDNLLNKHKGLNVNLSRNLMIREIVKRREAMVSSSGALATWTPWESTGRSPRDTYIVRDNYSESKVDWDSPNNNIMEPSTFDMIWDDALNTISRKDKLYITDRVLGADVRDALPVRTISDHALTALFTDNMFRPVPRNIEKSCLHKEPFTLLVLPYDRLDPKKYHGRLRLTDPEDEKSTSWMAISMDMGRRLGIVYGSAYLGSVKKLMFTVMNFIMPEIGVLPIHCSANEGEKGDCALMLGLSGTGKTSLSADPTRKLLGDDEHGWSDYGVFNFEYGCYAKMINLRKEKEPEIWNAIMHKAPYTKHGAIVENAMMYPNGDFDFDDKRYTENSRASYPLSFLTNIKKSSKSAHPKTIIFLAADANGVLPPIARLTTNQAMLWFLMGYTSKLAGTETGIIEPVSTFSRFFGQPFMPLVPSVYTSMFGAKLQKHKTKVFLINTGWSGGPYGVGSRIDITLTRRMLHAALDGDLDNVEYRDNNLFHMEIPVRVDGIPEDMLEPSNTWSSKTDYSDRAIKLAQEFCEKYDTAFQGKNLPKHIEIECPGK